MEHLALILVDKLAFKRCHAAQQFDVHREKQEYTWMTSMEMRLRARENNPSKELAPLINFIEDSDGCDWGQSYEHLETSTKLQEP